MKSFASVILVIMFAVILEWSVTEGRDKGFFILEWDLITTPEQVLKLRKGGGDNKGRIGMVSEASRWPNATIWYTVALTTFTVGELHELRRALQQFEQETCLKFREATPATSNFVLVRKGSGGCSSELGLSSVDANVQVMNLDHGCRYYGLFLHEFGHTIGLYHEHQHPMRENEIKVNINNVSKNMRNWFKPITYPFRSFGAPYDIQSVMHYGASAFSEDGSTITMQTLDPKRQRLLAPVAEKDLSYYDVYKINAMYKCAKHCGKVSCPAGNFVNKRCECVTPEAFAKRRCVNIDQNCESRKKNCESERLEMHIRCRKTCNACYVAE